MIIAVALTVLLFNDRAAAQPFQVQEIKTTEAWIEPGFGDEPAHIHIRTEIAGFPARNRFFKEQEFAVYLLYRAQGEEWEQVDMKPDGEGERYAARISRPSSSTDLEYTVMVRESYTPWLGRAVSRVLWGTDRGKVFALRLDESRSGPALAKSGP